MGFRCGGARHFCSRWRAAELSSKDTEAAGGAAARIVGAGIVASVLRASAVYVCGTDAAGKCGDAKRVEAGGIACRDLCGHAADRKNILKVGSEDRAKRQRRTGDSRARSRFDPAERGSSAP